MDISKLTKEQRELYSILQESGKIAVKKASHDYAVAVAFTLMSKLKFGKTRLTRIMLEIEDQFDSIQKDYVSLKDMEQALKDEADMEVK